MTGRCHHPLAPARPKSPDARRETGVASPAGQRIAQLQQQADQHVIQRVFAPYLTRSNAHLRSSGAWDDKIGGRIDGGSEVVADTGDQQVQNRRGPFSDVTWTKAVNKTGVTWDHAADHARTSYIRHSRLGALVDYTQKAPQEVIGTDRNMHPQPNWHPVTGAYELYEEAVFHPGHQIVRKGDGLRRRDPADGSHVALDVADQRQMTKASLEQYLMDQAKEILQQASAGYSWQAEFIKDANIQKLVNDTNGDSKALRKEQGLDLVGAEFVNWYRWLSGPFDRIRSGAVFTANMFEHWRDYLYPGNRDQVTISEINFTGSDLHEEGLGAIITKFTKPNGVGPAPYTNQTTVDVILKSEKKEIEKALFGTEGGSLANQVNAAAGLNANEAIRTFHMVTSNNYGTMIEMVRNAREHAKRDDEGVVGPAFYEALTFAFMTGMSDLHTENVLWSPNGQPYFIDADNALNAGRMMFTLKDEAEVQSGFSGFNRDEERAVIKKLKSDDPDYTSKILTALKGNTTPVIPLIRASFAGKSGRVVPVSTSQWAQQLKLFYIKYPEGDPADTDNRQTRWGSADLMSKVTLKPPSPQPGLEGETGKTGDGSYARHVEKLQIKADFDKGQIPFYVYHYDDGKVRHNGQRIWNGRSLADAIKALLVKFPNQR